MWKILWVVATSVVCSGLISVADPKVKTITGGAVCAKCSLRESKSCQNVVLTKENGKKAKYYLLGEVSKKAHARLGICTAAEDAPIPVEVTGEVHEKEGRTEMNVKKIEKTDEIDP